MVTYAALLKELGAQLEAAPDVSVDEFFIAYGASSKAVPAGFPESVNLFYKKLNGFTVEWDSPRLKKQLQVTGRVKVLPIHEVASDWSEVLWFAHTPADDPIRAFRILDFYVDEACVGFYAKGPDDPYLYFYDFDGLPVNLELDMEGYVQLLCAARGFRHWQRVIISFLTKKKNPEAQTFDEYMPQLFPDFSPEKFRNLYDRVKLHKPPKSA